MIRDGNPVPRNFALVAVCTLLADVVLVAPVPLLRIPLGLLLALFVPGYAVVSALGLLSGTPESEGDSAPQYVKLVTLSVGTSLVLTTLVALAFNFTPYGIELVPVLAGLNAITFLALLVATIRRWRLPPEQRSSALSSVSFDRLARLTDADTTYGNAMNVVLLLSLLLATGTVAYAVSTPDHGPAYTELYLLGQNESGEPVAGDFPSEFERNGTRTLYVGIDNREGSDVNYTVVAKIQRVRTANNSTTVLEERRLRRMDARIPRNGTELLEHRVTPTMVGEQLRLTYLLYVGQPPADPTAENAYRDVYLSISVSGNESAG